MLCGGDDAGTEIASTGEHECHICPVGVGEPKNAQTFGLGSMNPIIHQLVRNLKPPKFEDRAEDWPGFKWDFKEYLQKLSPTRPIPDAYKLGLLEEALTPTLKGEVKLMRKKNGGTLTYPEVLATFEARYSSGGVAKLRKKWSEVSLHTSGKVTSQQLREFQVNFLNCADDVKDTTPQEVRRVLMQKLTPWMKTWVVEGEQKKERNRPIVQIVALENMTESGMKKSIRDLIGESPLKVQILGQGAYRLTFDDYQVAKKLLSYHSREITGCPRPLQISLVEQQFTALEIFDMLHDKLANREKVDTYHQTW
jgi:hypothetical protein